MNLKAFSRAVESASAVDPVAAAVQRAVGRGYAAAGERGRRVRDFLHGVWLGHPVHPILVAIPIGAWTAAVAFDAADALDGRRDLRPGADAAIAVGIVGAVGSAVTGLTDWHHLDAPKSRRVGWVHAVLNTAALGLYVASLVDRLGGRRGRGRTLALMGFGLVNLSGYLGGELAYDQGIGVNHAGIQWPPDEYTPVMRDADLLVGEPRCAEAGGTPVMLVRTAGGIRALSNVCTHLGGPLHEGKVEGDTVVCPWHGSRFCLDTGAVLEGPATYPQPRWETRVRNGTIEVRVAS